MQAVWEVSEFQHGLNPAPDGPQQREALCLPGVQQGLREELVCPSSISGCTHGRGPSGVRRATKPLAAGHSRSTRGRNLTSVHIVARPSLTSIIPPASESTRGEKPYECKVCGKAFKRCRSFVQLQKLHPVETRATQDDPQGLPPALASAAVASAGLCSLCSGSCFQPLAHGAASMWSTLLVCPYSACLPGPAFSSEGFPL